MNEGTPGTATGHDEAWPPLPLDAWKDTRATLHMWLQIVGKVRLALAPPVNHWWHVPLYVTASGLTTSPIPYGARTFDVDVNLCSHELRVTTSDDGSATLPLVPRSVADFYREFQDSLRALGIKVAINPLPVEIERPIPFDEDEFHTAYDAAAAHRFWRALVQADRVLKAFRAGFVGKCSPVHFFWGSFDLAVTRFSGRGAPPHPSVPGVSDRITGEAYSHEVSSAGFWPGDDRFPAPIFYSYAYPEPPGFADAALGVPGAYYSGTLGEFVLPYERLRVEARPDATLLDFCERTYEAAATLGGWDRGVIERHPSEVAPPGVVLH